MWLDAKGWKVAELARELAISPRSVFDWLRGAHPPADEHRRELHRITGLECFRASESENLLKPKAAAARCYVPDLEAYRADAALEEARGEATDIVCRECGLRAKRLQPHIVTAHSDGLLEWLRDHHPRVLEPKRPRNFALLAYRLKWGYGRRAPLASKGVRSRLREVARQEHLALKARVSGHGIAWDASAIRIAEILRTGLPLKECAKRLKVSLSTIHRKARQVGWDTKINLEQRNMVVSYLFNLRRHLVSTPALRSVDEILAWHEAQLRTDSTGLFGRFVRFLPAFAEELRRPGVVKVLVRDHTNVMGLAGSILNRARPDAAPPTPSHEQPEASQARRLDSLPKKQADLSHHLDAARLTDRQHICLSLKFEYGFTVSAIARRLGLHRRTVQEHLQAGQRALNHASAYERRSRSRPTSLPEA
jgi:DNA-binding NarL/FixJ family response regulator/transcriptional regulator with XRE-family HTH domain